MYLKHQDKKTCLGPVKLFAAKWNNVFIFANGSMRKVPRCMVQICEADNDENENGEKEVEEKQKENSVRFVQ